MSPDAAFHERYGPWAVVAGSAMGLGAEYARQVAAHGVALLLLDHDGAGLDRTAREIRSTHPIEVRTAELDLGRPDLIDVVGTLTADIEVGLLVYNAAIGTVGRFLATPPDHCARMLDVNCRGPVLMVHALAPAMVARGRGGIVLMSSLSGQIGSKQLAVYAGTKAFDLVFAEALWAELAEHGVDVLAVQPGSTRTPGWQSSQPEDGRAAGPYVMEPDAVVREALAALGTCPTLVAGEQNREAAALIRSLPVHEAIELMSSITGHLTPNHP